jgi:hypothetical protein
MDSDAGLKHAPGPNERQITDWMTSVREQPLSVRRRAYEEGRLLDQVRWYGAKALENDARAKRWSLITIALQAAGVLAATLRVAGVLDVDLMGVAATAAAAATAWLASKDHSGLAEAYSTTAHELALVRDELPEGDDETGWGTFVADAEAAISREHTRWLARRRSLGSTGAAGRPPGSR